MKRFFAAFLVLALSTFSAYATTPLQPLVDACTGPTLYPCTITLAASTDYDDANPVRIDKDLLIVGPITAKVHSEFQIFGGATVEFRGFTHWQDKAGAPAGTGQPAPTFPQNGVIVVRGAQLYTTDVDFWHILPGGTAMKPVVEVTGGSFTFRAYTRDSFIHYALMTGDVMQCYYGSYCAVFGFRNPVSPYAQIDCGSDSGHACIQVASSTFVGNGMEMWNYNPASPCCFGINAIRASNIVLGASTANTNLHNFSVPYTLLHNSAKWVGPTSSPP